MIETLNDVLSLVMLVVLAIYFLHLLFSASVKDRERVQKRREALYYRLYDSVDNDDTDEGDASSTPYFGE